MFGLLRPAKSGRCGRPLVRSVDEEAASVVDETDSEEDSDTEVDVTGLSVDDGCTVENASVE